MRSGAEAEVAEGAGDTRICPPGLGLWATASPGLATVPEKVRVDLDADTVNEVDDRGRPRAR
jgi:hypothetical protein